MYVPIFSFNETISFFFTVIVLVAVFPLFVLAIIFTVPGETAVTIPLETVAILLSLLSHVTIIIMLLS